MNDPLNQLPVDPEWLRKIEELTERAAREAGCMVMIIAIQENGKLGLWMEGVPEAGTLHDIAQNVPLLLSHIATATALQDALGAMRPKQ